MLNEWGNVAWEEVKSQIIGKNIGKRSLSEIKVRSTRISMSFMSIIPVSAWWISSTCMEWHGISKHSLNRRSQPKSYFR